MLELPIAKVPSLDDLQRALVASARAMGQDEGKARVEGQQLHRQGVGRFMGGPATLWKMGVVKQASPKKKQAVLLGRVKPKLIKARRTAASAGTAAR